MFKRSAKYYDAIYGWKDYPAEVERLHALIEDRRPGARTLLDVACGTGKHLQMLSHWYEVEGLDLDETMVELARVRIPDVPLHVGDMAAFDLGRSFDVVTCLFSSIAYTRTPDQLDRAVGNLARHAVPGGLVVIEPWILPDAWIEGHVHADFVDEPDLKIARVTRSGPVEPVLTVEFHHLIATPDGIESFREAHVVGMFEHQQYVDAMERAGLTVEQDPEGLMGRGLYIGRRGE